MEAYIAPHRTEREGEKVYLRGNYGWPMVNPDNELEYIIEKYDNSATMEVMFKFKNTGIASSHRADAVERCAGFIPSETTHVKSRDRARTSGA